MPHRFEIRLLCESNYNFQHGTSSIFIDFNFARFRICFLLIFYLSFLLCLWFFFSKINHMEIWTNDRFYRKFSSINIFDEILTYFYQYYFFFLTLVYALWIVCAPYFWSLYFNGDFYIQSYDYELNYIFISYLLILNYHHMQYNKYTNMNATIFLLLFFLYLSR